MNAPPTADERPRGSILRNAYFWVVVMGLIVIPAMRPLLRRVPEPPPVLFELPPFELVDSRGESFGSENLDGRVYVADLIFTRCRSICPLLTRAMGQLDQRYRERDVDGVHLVSITVDPEFDTPAVLARYAARHGIDPERWSLLTGPTEEVRSLVVQGFRLPLGEEAAHRSTGEDDLIDIAHSGKFVLVDGDGGVRGYYDTDPTGLDEIFHRSLHVLRESSD